MCRPGPPGGRRGHQRDGGQRARTRRLPPPAEQLPRHAVNCWIGSNALLMSGPEPWWRCTTENRYPWLKPPRSLGSVSRGSASCLGNCTDNFLPGFGHEVDLSNSFSNAEGVHLWHGRRFSGAEGTRDFLPEDLAQRQWIEDRWRTVSTNHGFEEIDGPTFEHLSLYTTKSGDGIVSELFSFRRSGGDDDYALRPELTPTVARLAADAVRQRPMPLRWFGIGPFFRGERPQRGRLRSSCSGMRT